MGWTADSVVARARSWGKLAFSGHAIPYELAKRIFVLLRVTMDRIIFAKRNRGVPYIYYAAKELSVIRDRGFVSQYGQDYYLWHAVLSGQTPGFFIDIGGNDPLELSNSLYLERHGWKGIAFDPLRQMEERWKRARKATFYQVAISDTISQRTFVEILPSEGWEHTLSGFSNFVRREDMEIYGYREYLVPTAPISEFVGTGTLIDLILVDVEGAEREVIAGLALRTHRARYVLVENVSKLGGDDAVRTLITAEGYRLIARIGAADDLFELAPGQ